MLINFEKEIYEKTWAGNVDKILSYDTEKLQFTVQDIKSGKIRKHNTSLEIENMGFNPNVKSSTRRDKEEIEIYLENLSVKHITPLKKIPQIIFAVKEIEGKTLVYLADKKTFVTKVEVIDPYNLYESFMDGICEELELENEDECVYVAVSQTSKEPMKSNLYAYGLYENNKLLKEF